MDFQKSLESDINFETNFNFSSSLTNGGISAETFIKLAELDFATGQNILLEEFSNELIVNDTTENLKNLIINNSDYVLAAKRYISGFSNNSDT